MAKPLTKEEKTAIQLYVDTGDDSEMSSEADFKLYEAFYNDMPYGVAKARDGTPYDWYPDHLDEIQNWLDEQTVEE